jgi:hypothetical protein
MRTTLSIDDDVLEDARQIAAAHDAPRITARDVRRAMDDE